MNQNLEKLMMMLCHEIERLPASVQQTNVSMMASQLQKLAAKVQEERDHYKEAYQNMRAFAESKGLNTYASNTENK